MTAPTPLSCRTTRYLALLDSCLELGEISRMFEMLLSTIVRVLRIPVRLANSAMLSEHETTETFHVSQFTIPIVSVKAESAGSFHLTILSMVNRTSTSVVIDTWSATT